VKCVVSFGVVAAIALAAACDKGKVEPAKGSAAPEPAPLPVPDPAPPPVDAMSIDEQLLNGSLPEDPVVWVRACNRPGKTMTAIEWHEKYKATFVKNGECTRYEKTTGAYSYTYAKFNLGKDEFIIQPIDYMGEKQLVPGVYSYDIKIIDYGHRSADIRASLDSDSLRIEVRECNDTSFVFRLSSVHEVPVVKDGGALKAGACTPYYIVKEARSISSASFVIGKDDNFYIQPTDAIGWLLSPGKWSYRLSITDGRDHDARMIVKQDPR
jgi:hypothetical protein